MLTSAGIIFFIVIFVTVFILISRLQNDHISFHSSISIFDRIFWYIISGIPSFLMSIFAVIMIYGLLLLTSKSIDSYHTIYSNKIKATVSFLTDFDGTEFVSGKQIKDTSDIKSGTLTLSKDGVDVKTQIDHVEYLGDNDKGSIVEKIEYSDSLKEVKLFNVTLIRQKSNQLRIYLKKPASQIVKEKKNAETQKELKSLLESSN